MTLKSCTEREPINKMKKQLGLCKIFMNYEPDEKSVHRIIQENTKFHKNQEQSVHFKNGQSCKQACFK